MITLAFAAIAVLAATALITFTHLTLGALNRQLARENRVLRDQLQPSARRRAAERWTLENR